MPLDLTKVEQKVEELSFTDGRTDKEIRLACDQDIYLGIFFDGTNNNKFRDEPGKSHSNVARLYEAFPGTNTAQKPPVLLERPGHPRKIVPDRAFPSPSVPPADLPYYRKIYVPGLGTPMLDVGDTGQGMHKSGGLGMALLGDARLAWGMLQICNQVHAAVFSGTTIEKSIDIAALKAKKPGGPSLPLVLPDFLRQPLEKEMNKLLKEFDKLLDASLQERYEKTLRDALKPRLANKPRLRKLRLSVFGFSRGAALARVFVNRVEQRWGNDFFGIPLQIDFLGIFDTVASVGVAQTVPGANGHFEWADHDQMVVPGSVKRCAHLVSSFEQRGAFPLDSVCQGSDLPVNCKEIVYPGVHSDVGGGYPPGDQGRSMDGDSCKLSQIALAQMYREARMAGVPLAPPSAMTGFRLDNFKIDPKLRETFNDYVEVTRSGPRLEPTNGKGDPAFARMYPSETQPRGETSTIIRTHAGYLLQWRKAMLERAGGAGGLPALQQNPHDSVWQDIADIKGAEAELRKEINFLLDKNPDKYKIMDDLFLDTLQTGLSAGKLVAPVFLSPHLLAVLYGVDWYRRDGILTAMKDKQLQWDLWLKHDWFGEGALEPDAAAKAGRLFEHYAHDSRAWFKAFMRTDGHGMTPDDESWFTLGGRDAELAKRKQQAQAGEEGSKQKRELALLSEKGQPLLLGGREPYRMWGYVRHRRIYQSGVLAPQAKAQHKKQQQTISKEEQLRQKEDMLADENARHEKEKQRIRDTHHRVLTNPKSSEFDKADSHRAAKYANERADADHKKSKDRIAALFP